MINKDKYIGLVQLMHNGMRATIIEYRGSTDLDVRFEDGTVVQHRTYYDFRRGHIKNPERTLAKNNSGETRKTQGKNRIGETRIMNNGMIATVIAYRNCKDIDIKFEDGNIIEHRYYRHFLSGCIGNKNDHILTEKELSLLELKYINKMRVDEISKKFDIEQHTIRLTLRGAITKLVKRYINDSSISITEEEIDFDEEESIGGEE